MSDLPPGRGWQLYGSAYRGDGSGGQDLTSKQAALLDIIDACSWATPGAIDTTTTAEAARLAGCDIDSAWFALLGIDWLEFYRPDDIGDVELSPFAEAEDMPQSLRAMCQWGLPDDMAWDVDDEEWYSHRIEAAKRTGIQLAIDHWVEEAKS